jgi:hypothetical protein
MSNRKLTSDNVVIELSAITGEPTKSSAETPPNELVAVDRLSGWLASLGFPLKLMD